MPEDAPGALLVSLPRKENEESCYDAPQIARLKLTIAIK